MYSTTLKHGGIYPNFKPVKTKCLSVSY